MLEDLPLRPLVLCCVSRWPLPQRQSKHSEESEPGVQGEQSEKGEHNGESEQDE